ncbi:MAG TPA: hypothetical protein VGM82_14235 [Gemmatimonadaceae bacterium]|jgi:hypothetical protein
MALFDKLRSELDRAGRQAQRALDEGRLRLDLYRARQSTDRFAQRLGYTVFRAKKEGREVTPDEMLSHINNLTASEAEVARLETLIAEASKDRKNPFETPKPADATEPPPPPAP